MSIFRRNFFDKIQNSSFTNLRLPTPPSHDPAYWDRAYKELSPEDCFEWGGFDLKKILNFRYEHVPYEGKNGSDEKKETYATTFSEWIDVAQHSSPEEASQKYQEARLNNEEKNDSILLLGCGNSKMGEQLLVNSFQGPFIHLDVSSKLITAMTQRYEKYLKEAAVQRMEFIVDDAATGLTSLEPESVGGAVIDKGLLDSLHCSLGNINDESHENWGMVQNIVNSVHRVLQPSRSFVFFSRSSPEYMMRRVFGGNSDAVDWSRQWMDISAIKLIDLDVMLYRFIKAVEDEKDDIENNTCSHVTTRAFRKKQRSKRN